MEKPCQTLNRASRSRILAQLILVISLSLSQIGEDSSIASVYGALPEISTQKPKKHESRSRIVRCFPINKESPKPIWNDGLPNSAKRRRQHKRRGLYLRDPKSIWGLGFVLARYSLVLILRGKPQAIERGNKERRFRSGRRATDTKEARSSSSTGHMLGGRLKKLPRSYPFCCNNNDSKIMTKCFEYVFDGFKLICRGLISCVCSLLIRSFLSNYFGVCATIAWWKENIIKIGKQSLKKTLCSDKEPSSEQYDQVNPTEQPQLPTLVEETLKSSAIYNRNKEPEQLPTMVEETLKSSAIYNRNEAGPSGIKKDMLKNKAKFDMGLPPFVFVGYLWKLVMLKLGVLDDPIEVIRLRKKLGKIGNLRENFMCL